MRIIDTDEQLVRTYTVEPVEVQTFKGPRITVERIRVTDGDRVEVWNATGSARNGLRGWRVLTSDEDERILRELGVQS